MSKKNKRSPSTSPYVQCWRTMKWTVEQVGDFSDWLHVHARARVIQISSDQVDALPPAADNWFDETDLIRDARLPFAKAFLSIGGKFPPGDSRPWADTPLYGALLRQVSTGGVLLVPFWSNGTVGAQGVGMSHELEEVDAPQPTGDARRDRAYGRIQLFVEPPVQVKREAAEAVSCGMIKAMRVVYFLESSNVELVEVPGPPRGHIAHGVPHYEVEIRQGKRSPQRETGNDAPEWSHRWEVRGHYKHHREGSPIFRAASPEKVLDLPGGRCVRVWCPPFVKGPLDKPLIPKRRVAIAP